MFGPMRSLRPPALQLSPTLSTPRFLAAVRGRSLKGAKTAAIDQAINRRAMNGA